MYYVYLLKSVSSGSNYIGQTSDVHVRLARHNRGLVPSTKAKSPWTLVGYDEYPTREQARWREYQLKHSAHQRKLFIEKFKK